MDIFSHALLPYLLGSFFRQKRENVTAFVLGGIAPDFDVFIMWINFVYPTFFLITHRGLTHSLFFGFFTGLAVLYLASRDRIKTRINKFIDFRPAFTPRAAVFAFAGVVLHLFLDYTTTRGVPLLYPLETMRFSAEVFFYTDLYLTILSLIIIVLLYKKIPQKYAVTKFLVIFLIAFAVLGGVRIDEKKNTLDFFKNAKAYPTESPFDWYVISGDDGLLKIYEYDALERIPLYNTTVLRLRISGGENPEAALHAADDLPQIKLFKWRAYAVAVNASFNDGKWLLQYYDPLQRAMIRDIPAVLSRINAPINVTVTGGKAFIS